MPEDRDLDLPDDAPLIEDEEDVVGVEDDSEEEFEDVDDEELDDEPRDQETTDEVGSEGGSPGDAFGQSRSRVGSSKGSEASETWRPGERDRMMLDYRDVTERPRRRSPL
jgi:hypothetical protein